MRAVENVNGIKYVIFENFQTLFRHTGSKDNAHPSLFMLLLSGKQTPKNATEVQSSTITIYVPKVFIIINFKLCTFCLCTILQIAETPILLR